MALWVSLGSIYGMLWEDNFGDHEEAVKVWLSGLRQQGITPEDTKRGLEALIKAGDQYPPALTRFISLCKAPKREPYHKLYEELPTPRADPVKARSLLAEAIRRLK
jgi:hypothetical protein